MVTSEPQAVSPRIPLRWGRILCAALLVKLCAASLTFLVPYLHGFFGGDLSPVAASAFKQHNYAWIWPVASSLFFFLFSWWAAKGARGHQILHGALVGVAVLLIELALGARFENASGFLFEAGLAIAASSLGGWVAARRAVLRRTESSSMGR